MNHDIMRFFFPVYLTTFFFVSGYLFKSNVSFLKVLEQRTRTLLLPLLIFGTMMIVMSQVFTMKDEPLSWADSFLGLLFQRGTGGETILWFIAALYVYSLLFYWIERFSGRYLLLASIALFVLNWIYSSAFHGPYLPWHISYIGYGCAYMGLGKVYREHENEVTSKVTPWLLVVALVVYVEYIALFDRTCSFSGSKNLIDALLLTGLGLLLMIEGCKRVKILNNKFILFVGQNTLFYFAFHGKVQSIMHALADRLSIEHTPLTNDVLGIAITICIAAILILPAYIVSRYLPWMLGRGFYLWRVSK